jgi:hypothetical protein
MTAFDAGTEFDRQARTLVELGYPAIAGLSTGAFLEQVGPLRAVAVARAGSAAPPARARVPFLLVVTRKLVPADLAMPLTALNGKPGFADFAPDDIRRFAPVDTVPVPEGLAYLVLDVERGAATRNVRPDDAMVMITALGRTPLTVEEGIALVTQYPAALEKNNCFSLVASRCGDRRVPAIWISRGAPKLGWCWAGNPHTWLGSASCAGRA